MKFENVSQVATCRLCIGCGTCAYICPEEKVQLVDIEHDGIRPIVLPDSCGSCNQCLMACPGLSTTAFYHPSYDGAGDPPEKYWGRILELWEGYASNAEIRLKGSSGGLCTALSLYCLENNVAGGVLHVGADPELPWKNKTFRSLTREDLIRRTGSRYSPASPCDGLKQIEGAVDASVFVGKPCDIAGLRLAQQMRPNLEKKTSLAIGFFCAGTPSTSGTLELLRKIGVDVDAIDNLRYRGIGWPGMATVEFKEQGLDPVKMSYKDSWGFVQKYRPFRCYLCPDLTAESADISVGDPWYRQIGENEPGRSLILIRTEKGREIFNDAVAAGYIEATPADYEIIYRSQKNLLGKRQAIWGRLLAMKILGIPYPRLKGFHLWDNWVDLPTTEKVKSVLGTARRIVQRNYFTPVDYTKYLDRI